MARLGDHIREECHPLGSAGAQELRLIGVSNEHGLHPSSRETSADLARYQRIEKNWFAYNPMRVNVGSIGLADDESKTGFTSPDYTVFSCRKGLDPHYLLHFLKSDYGHEAIARNCSGAVRKRLYYSGLAEIELPVPSPAEQRAFVERIDGISETIRFIRDENSDRHELPLLKQAILQEAIQGKLTADWRAAHPDAEPASQLLERIQAEKARLIADKKLRPEKPLPQITPVEIPFEIPEGWEWCRMGSIAEEITKGSSPTWQGIRYVDESAGGILFVTSKNVGSGEMLFEKTSFVEARFNEIEPRSILQKNDILTNLVGASIARTALFDLDCIANINQAVALIRIAEDCINKPLLVAYMNSAAGVAYMLEKQFSPGRANLSLTDMAKMLIPLPPLAEQVEIVKRVEALMETCRALETEIAQARTHAAHLLQAVLKEAFAPAA